MASVQHSHADLVSLWMLAGGDPTQADVAAAIAEAESGGCQYAKAGPNDDRPQKVCVYRYTTGENSYGLWQVNRNAHPTYSAASLYTAIGNATAAVAISSHGANFQPWSTYMNGAYKRYLQRPQGPFPGPEAGDDATAGPLAASGHRGYADLRNSVARHLPRQLERSRQTGQITLQLLARKRKIGG